MDSGCLREENVDLGGGNIQLQPSITVSAKNSHFLNMSASNLSDEVIKSVEVASKLVVLIANIPSLTTINYEGESLKSTTLISNAAEFHFSIERACKIATRVFCCVEKRSVYYYEVEGSRGQQHDRRRYYTVVVDSYPEEDNKFCEFCHFVLM